ncbi:hypothetical protein KSF78_0004036 [Schistosoma japonicum]|nr:hypothetical protein KSF78_0004036 [Schistosoma japonicum]
MYFMLLENIGSYNQLLKYLLLVLIRPTFNCINSNSIFYPMFFFQIRKIFLKFKLYSPNEEFVMSHASSTILFLVFIILTSFSFSFISLCMAFFLFHIFFISN